MKVDYQTCFLKLRYWSSGFLLTSKKWRFGEGPEPSASLRPVLFSCNLSVEIVREGAKCKFFLVSLARANHRARASNGSRYFLSPCGTVPSFLKLFQILTSNFSKIGTLQPPFHFQPPKVKSCVCGNILCSSCKTCYLQIS